MKKILFLFMVLSLILLVSCSKENPVSKTYIIQEPQYQAFTIEHKSGLSEFKEMQEKTAKRRATNNKLQRTDEETDECINKITKNWRRIIDDKLVMGYDEKEDSDMKFRIRKAVLKGEIAC